MAIFKYGQNGSAFYLPENGFTYSISGTPITIFAAAAVGGTFSGILRDGSNSTLMRMRRAAAGSEGFRIFVNSADLSLIPTNAVFTSISANAVHSVNNAGNNASLIYRLHTLSGAAPTIRTLSKPLTLTSETVDITSLSTTIAQFFEAGSWFAFVQDPISDTRGADCAEFSIWVTFALPTPVITTLPPATAGSTAAILFGSLDPNGATASYPVRWKFEYGNNPSMGTFTSSTDATGTGTQSVQTTLVGLNPATTYYYRLVGVTDDATINGSTESFVTLDSDPSLYTL